MAVKTIHEERIVHSDLKPGNFLLVRGSLNLIDFGIAKAIMNDTTNIQRDSQVSLSTLPKLALLFEIQMDRILLHGALGNRTGGLVEFKIHDHMKKFT